MLSILINIPIVVSIGSVCILILTTALNLFVLLAVIHTSMINDWFYLWKEIVICGSLIASDCKVIYQLYVDNTIYFCYM